MSRRTSEANKATRQAWQREQKLVQEGKGTRDWTAEQQQDILDKGKAYDDGGKAFEGHHMQNAEMRPEYQGEPDNIQFLTREEHLEAHNNDWKNPTNGYYDYITGEMIDFGLGKYEPCKIIDLSNPIAINIIPADSETGNAHSNATQQYEGGGKAKVTEEPWTSSSTVKSDNTAKSAVVKPQVSEEKEGLFKRIVGRVVGGLAKTEKFVHDHRKEIGIATLTIAGYVLEEIIRNGNSGGGNSSNNDDHSTSVYTNSNYKGSPPASDDYTEAISVPDDIAESSTHTAPCEHEVPGHSQRYHTKNGVEWREKLPYPRCRKKDADTD